MVLSSQRCYKKRIFEEGIDHSDRGLSQGQEGSTEDETELFGGIQLAYAFYMAYEEDCSNSNVQRVLQLGYQVSLLPRTLPLDVKIEIVKHSNRHHDGIKVTVLEMISGVAEVQQSFAKCFVSQSYELKDLRAEIRLHILRHGREICAREPCGDVGQEVGDIQRGESHLPPMGARLCCRPEDVTACCVFG